MAVRSAIEFWNGPCSKLMKEELASLLDIWTMSCTQFINKVKRYPLSVAQIKWLYILFHLHFLNTGKKIQLVCTVHSTKRAMNNAAKCVLSIFLPLWFWLESAPLHPFSAPDRLRSCPAWPWQCAQWGDERVGVGGLQRSVGGAQKGGSPRGSRSSVALDPCLPPLSSLGSWSGGLVARRVAGCMWRIRNTYIWEKSNTTSVDEWFLGKDDQPRDALAIRWIGWNTWDKPPWGTLE